MPRLFVAACCLFAAAPAAALDWPEWRGPGRDAVWREEGIVESLPEDGLDYQWRVPCGIGYAGPAVAGGRVYLFEYEQADGQVTNNPGGRDELNGKERLRCLVSETGEELWKYEYDRPYAISYPNGPRCTPTVDGERLYILGAEGDLACLKVADGSVAWKKNFAEDYGAPTPLWGHSAHPLVDGDTLYCLVGGEGSVVVAFDKFTGEEKWSALSTPSINNECGYCPPTMIRNGGYYELVAFHPEGVAGLDPESGEELWSVPLRPSYGMSIAQPLRLNTMNAIVGPSLFVTGYGGPSVFFKLPRDDDEPEILWSGTPKTSVSSANASPIPDPSGPTVYGVDANSSALCAIDMTNGERLWETQEPTLGEDGRSRARHGTVFLVRQGDTERYWLASETGDLILAKLTPESYEELGRHRIVEPTGETFGREVWWSHPAYAERAVFARNDEELVRVNLAAE